MVDAQRAKLECVKASALFISHGGRCREHLSQCGLSQSKGPRMKFKLSCVVIGLCAMAGCGSDEELSLPTVDCSNGVAVPTYAKVEALTTCASCHSSKLSGAQRHDAPTDINFDTYEAAKVAAQKAASEVNTNSMPPADSKLTLSQTAKEELYRWGLCGTPNG
jgi:uncharacterized membrane protein